LEHKGLVDSDWQATENNRRGRYYRLTPPGGEPSREVAKWKRFAGVIQLVLES